MDTFFFSPWSHFKWINRKASLSEIVEMFTFFWMLVLCLICGKYCLEKIFNAVCTLICVELYVYVSYSIFILKFSSRQRLNYFVAIPFLIFIGAAICIYQLWWVRGPEDHTRHIIHQKMEPQNWSSCYNTWPWGSHWCIALGKVFVLLLGTDIFDLVNIILSSWLLSIINIIWKMQCHKNVLISNFLYFK